ncbi:MAG: hypothetical protein DDT30_02055 [Dehalococcoidia bacterium]|nr:hypothetical protein [Bacillota bacterium]
MLHNTSQQQLRRLPWVDCIMQLEVDERIDPLPHRENLQHQIGDRPLERDRYLLAAQIGQSLHCGVGAYDIVDVPHRDIEQLNAHSLIVEGRCHIGGHGHKITLPAGDDRLDLSRVFPDHKLDLLSDGRQSVVHHQVGDRDGMRPGWSDKDQLRQTRWCWVWSWCWRRAANG